MLLDGVVLAIGYLDTRPERLAHLLDLPNIKLAIAVFYTFLISRHQDINLLLWFILHPILIYYLLLSNLYKMIIL